MYIKDKYQKTSDANVFVKADGTEISRDKLVEVLNELLQNRVDENLGPHDEAYIVDLDTLVGTGYFEARKKAYASAESQLEMQYDDLIDSTTTWKDNAAYSKAKLPTPD